MKPPMTPNSKLSDHVYSVYTVLFVPADVCFCFSFLTISILPFSPFPFFLSPILSSLSSCLPPLPPSLLPPTPTHFHTPTILPSPFLPPSLPHSLTHTLTLSLPPSLPHSLTHTLTLSLPPSLPLSFSLSIEPSLSHSHCPPFLQPLLSSDCSYIC